MTADPAAHLSPEAMQRAQRRLVAKAIAEFAHERLLAPEPVTDAAAPASPLEHRRSARPGSDTPGDASARTACPPSVVRTAEQRASAWRLETDGSEYRFHARLGMLEHWAIEEDTLTRTVAGAPAPLDAQQLIIELQAVLGIPDHLLGTYLEEIASTLASAAFKIHRGGPAAEDLAVADFQTIESAMTEGHPGFVANNGRIGFGVSEYRAYAPEAGQPFRLVWLAARRELSHLATGEGLDEDALLRRELDADERERFAARLDGLGLDMSDYRLLPVHPWQWEHRVAVTFAPDLARRDLVFLGEGRDEYAAQQSVRTMFNRSRPDRDYVKTALAVQNMGFLRGLSPAYMRVTPAINDWVAHLVEDDATLRDAGFRMLREHASVGYSGDAYHRTAAPSAQRKMLAALWRESPVPLVRTGERPATMASLLHRDAAGRSVATALVRRSGLPATDWLRAYLEVYLRPVVHCLLAHDLAFMPHGENLILILDGAVPTGVFMKDIGEEVALLSDRAVPDDVRRIVSPVDDREKALAVFTDVFDGVLRHVSGILHADGTLPEAVFWSLVADVVDEHAAQHPDLDSAVDLRAESFAHSCLNRLQLRNTLQMVDLANQSASLLYAGELANPIARSARPAESLALAR
ncbi:IucA/IucC family siderophore biosynthesis protein [Microbacterium sp. BK668]|uniref:IucA/IucC family protein n=1 Tax=Microbacterium sp. BK668 TaxID=2512118 RepID=UPI00105DBDC5|nr:IucA/IucC family siderophore biosynthesis protein [Microbacterium sp. BK668]TDN91750.1 siderophore synthetase component [Microbacterium sp. BK668]